MVPAFKSVTEQPAGQFSKALVAANANGGNYAVRFGEMPDGFGMNTLGPIFELLAADAITTEDFCTLVASAIAEAAAQ
jgi:raffinose/stachyose/melibiose transport system substrate-binding protein